jgi:hypothetical protein
MCTSHSLDRDQAIQHLPQFDKYLADTLRWLSTDTRDSTFGLFGVAKEALFCNCEEC